MFKPIEDRVIIPADFPELAKLVWNRDPMRPIDGETARALYDRNWRFVDTEMLTRAEAALIADLDCLAA